MRLGEEWWEFPEVKAPERDVLDHLEISLDDFNEDHTGEISFEHDVSLTFGVDESVLLFVEYHGTCHDALPALEDDGIQVPEILGGVGAEHIYGYPLVDAVFGVDHAADGGCQLGTKMF